MSPANSFLVRVKTLYGRLSCAVTSSRFWTIIGAVAGALALILTSYVFYAGADLSKRTLEAGLALDAHEKVYEFLAQVNQNYSAKAVKAPRPGGDPIHPEIRLAFVRAEGAIARAYIIDNEDIRACLTAMSFLMGGLIESSMTIGKDFSVEEYVLEMDAFPDMVKRHLLQEPLTPEQRRTTRDNAASECGPMPFELP